MSDFQQKLDELRKKQPNELSADDLAFMKARRSYLTAEEKKKFGLEEKTATPPPKASKAA
jgi:hypothetical protein